MFEALITVCVGLDAGPCRDQLLPGYEAESVGACESSLASRPPKPVEQASAPFCAPVGAALAVEEVAPGIFVHNGLIEEPDADNAGDVANLGFIVGTSGVAVIDTGSARWMGEALWRSVRATTDLPVTHVILTHMHPDHVLGASLFSEAGAEIVAHDALPRALADRAGNYLESLDVLIGSEAFLGTEPPDITATVTGTMSIDLGNRLLEVTAMPPAHTGTDLTVFDAATGVLFSGDLVFHRHTPALDGTLIGWRSVLDVLTAQEFSGVVPGHGEALLDWPEGGADIERYLGVLESDSRAAVSEGLRLGDAVKVIAADEAEHWDLFDAYNPRNATVAFTELEWE